MPTLPTHEETHAARDRVAECEAAVRAARAAVAREEANIEAEGRDAAYRRLFDLEADLEAVRESLETARGDLETLEDRADNGTEDHWHEVQERLMIWRS